MSATLNLVGLATLLIMSATLLNGAGIPVSTYIHTAVTLLSSNLPFQIPHL